jgi:hypothetical protein
MRPVLFATLLALLLLHVVMPAWFDIGTLGLLLAIYLLAVGSGGLEAARLSSAGDGRRRQERLAEDALRRAGKLQSHLDPCTATDDVVNHLLASGADPRRMVIVAANEVEDALRAVYRHYAETERLAGTSNGTDLPLIFEVQELIYRGLLPIDVWETADPIFGLRDLASAPRSQVSQQVATDIARATQSIVLRVQSLGIRLQTSRSQPVWLRQETDYREDEPLYDGADLEREPRSVETLRAGDGLALDGDRLGASGMREPIAAETTWRELRQRQGLPEPMDTLP